MLLAGFLMVGLPQLTTNALLKHRSRLTLGYWTLQPFIDRLNAYPIWGWVTLYRLSSFAFFHISKYFTPFFLSLILSSSPLLSGLCDESYPLRHSGIVRGEGWFLPITDSEQANIVSESAHTQQQERTEREKKKERINSLLPSPSSPGEMEWFNVRPCQSG